MIIIQYEYASYRDLKVILIIKLCHDFDEITVSNLRL